MFYYIIFLIILLLVGVENSYKNHQDNEKIKAILLNVSICALFFIGAFRWKTGNDWYNYEIMFNKLGYINQLYTNTKVYIENYNDIELGYRIFNSLIKSVGLGFQSVLFLSNLFLMYALHRFIRKNSKHYMLSVLIYYSIFFLHFNMSLIRQGFALGFFMIAIDKIYERHFLKFILITIIGSLFHISILVTIPVYFLYNLRIKKTLVTFILFFAYVIRLLSISVSKFILIILPGFIISDLEHYIDTYEAVSMLSFGNLERLIMAVIIIFTYEKIVDFNKNSKLSLNMYLIYLLFNLLLYENIGILTRIRFYFQLQYIILIPILLSLLKVRFNRLIAYVYIISLCIIPLFNFLNGYINSLLYNPYKNYVVHKIVFNEDYDGDEKYERIIDYIKNGGR